MSLSRDHRQERKLKAIRWAEFRLKQRLEAIDWQEDTLLPEVAAMQAGKPVLGLSGNMAFDIEVVREDSDPTKTSNGDQ